MLAIKCSPFCFAHSVMFVRPFVRTTATCTAVLKLHNLHPVGSQFRIETLVELLLGVVQIQELLTLRRVMLVLLLRNASRC